MTWRTTVRITAPAVGLIAAAIVVAAFYLDVQDSSPGELASVHAQHADLVGANHCAACHGAPGQSMTQACLNCHKDIGEQIDKARGLHGKLARKQASACAKCHSDHHGADFQVTSARSFALAGIADPRRFDHAGLDFHLAGKHLKVGCEKCHPNAKAARLPVGQKRFLGLGQNCTSCHQDVHKGAYGQDCASCHGQEHPFPRAARFEHTLAFALVGAHGQAACHRCHAKDSPGSVASLVAARSQAPQSPPSVRTCRACHASPHNESFLKTVSSMLKTDADQSCARCHPAIHTSFRAPEATLSPPLHACTGFSLTPPHNKAACTACHAGLGKPKTQLASFRQSFPGRHPDDCRACHGDPHQGQFEKGPFRGADCLACHQRHTFLPAAFTKDQHQKTGFPLFGAHVQVACNSCHLLPEDSRQTTRGKSAASAPAIVSLEVRPGGTEPARIFHGTPTKCSACHRDPHQGQFELGRFRGADCSACHSQHTFRISTFTLEAHHQAGFPLTGAHQAVACNECHQPKGASLLHPLADRSSRRSRKDGAPPAEQQRDKSADLDIVFRGTPATCSACHVDVHQGQFDQPHLPATIAGKTDCARCHTTERFDQVLAESFDHLTWTGYALRGAHAEKKCIACHVPSEPDSHGRTFGRVANRNCQSCHADPHVGQFGPTERVSCTQCHVEGKSFRELAFDHQKHSQFKLDRDHVNLACSACHKPQPLSGGRSAVRYKPLGTKCGDCHVPRGPRPAGTRSPR